MSVPNNACEDKKWAQSQKIAKILYVNSFSSIRGSLFYAKGN